jgi:hypothetical protein
MCSRTHGRRLEIGDGVRLSREQFERLYEAFLAELEAESLQGTR